MAAYALIADADPGQAQIYRHIALAEGLEVQLVRDGEQAQQLLRTLGAPALTITELSLPRADGFSLLAELRKLAGPELSPAVVVSAFRELRDAAWHLKEELGISTLLARGAPVESIRRAVKKALSRSAAPHGPAPKPTVQQRDQTTNVGEPDPEKAEEVRLAHLDEKKLVDDRPPDEVLQKIVRDAAMQFNVPMALISLVLEDRQWFKAHVGLSGRLLAERGTPLDQSFCRHAVQGRQPLVIPDAAVHPLFSKNPLVLDGTMRSYAGAPLETPGGDVLGTLCIIDTKPMNISAEDVDQLVMLARLVAGELELLSEARKHELQQKRLAPVLKADKDQSLRTALSYLSAVMDNIDNGVFLLDEERTVVLANPALADIFGHSVEALIGRKRDHLLLEFSQQFADPTEFLRRLRTAPTGPYALRGDFEMTKPKRRAIRWVTKPVRLGKGIGHMGVVTDITAELDLLAEREHLARTDPITGLANRRGGEEALEREASRGQRFGSRVSLALFDIDHFKQANDRYGHATGDEVLRAVAGVLNHAVRGADIVVRWGGDELLAILPNTGLDGARSFGERVRAGVEALDPVAFHKTTLSCGLAELQPGEDPTDAVRRADERLYVAKEQGRNRVA